MIYVIDLFCGCGGFSEGARQAGAEVILAVDNWQEALDVHKRNHPDTVHWEHEMGGDFDEFCAILNGFIDMYVPTGSHVHLHASPPCQNLSQANHGRNEEEGMRLVKWAFAIIDHVDVDSWTLEQVNNIHVRNFLDRYPGVVVDMKDYGLPATRKRVLFGNIVSGLHKTKRAPKTLREITNELGVAVPSGYEHHTGRGRNKKGRGYSFAPIDTVCRTVTCTAPFFYNTSDCTSRTFPLKLLRHIQTFPTNYLLTKNVTTCKKLIGNAFPPLMARKLIDSLINAVKIESLL